MSFQWKSVLQFVVTAVAVIAVGWLIWTLGGSVWDAFTQASPEVKAASVTALGSVSVLVAGRAYDRSRAIEQDLRKEKIAVYDDFVGFWFEVLFAKKLNRPQPTEQQVVKSMTDFTHRLLFWGSDRVVREWGDLYQQFQKLDATKPSPPEMLFEFEQMLYAIRRDTGHKNRGLGRGGLLRLFINDIDEHI